ncbi:MAG: uroporphyrinogen-III synthase [Candidatus Bathyarchaeota archaeon]|nr:uroporphyrinogen-III synthase [Candidatus Bathyarchaeota archaeon]
MVQTNSLNGKTVATTRPRGQNQQAAQIIQRLGGKPYLVPTIEIKPPTDLAPIREFIMKLERSAVDYTVFMSTNGVNHLFEAAEKLELQTALQKGLKSTAVVAVGPQTAQELQTRGVQVELIPEKYTSEGILQMLRTRGVQGKLIGIPRTSAAAPTLKETLTHEGANVEEVYVYESKLPQDKEANSRFASDLLEGKIDAVVFGSSMSARNLFRLVEPEVSSEQLRVVLNGKVVVVAIGPVTAEALEDLGVVVDVVPEKHLFEDALLALARFWAR